jgi:hypothetical protein
LYMVPMVHNIVKNWLVFVKTTKPMGVDFTSLLKIDWSNLKFLKN